MSIETTRKQNNSVFDIAKFMMALMVVAIHNRLYPELLFPWIRMAVPLFFVMSSYFLFEKLNRLTTESEKDRAVYQYIVRNFKLYLFYSVLFFPIYAKDQQWFVDGIARGLVLMVREVIFGSTFTASWFITACIIGTLLVYYGGKYVSDGVLIAISLAVYIFIVIRSAYTFIIDDYPMIIGLYLNIEKVIIYIMLSFPAGLFWIVCGKLFAEKKINMKMLPAVAGTVISGIALYLEADYVDHQFENYYADCYLLMVPFAIFVFAVLKQLSLPPLPWAIFLRKISIVIFATHAYTMRAVGGVLRRIGLYTVPLQYLLTVGACMGLGLIILWLEKKRGFGWLKYAH